MTNTNSTSESQNSRNSPKERREAQEPTESGNGAERPEREGRPKRAEPAAEDRLNPMEVLREARAQLTELTGLTPESVTSFEQSEDGWQLEVEVLELARVPDTMSLMASYQVELDPQGRLTGYRRARRYERGRSDARRGGR
ncbi:gas vesicle protein [Streptomyces sp. NPDC006739]|uniref:gas vesicle protein GvpO n=1 Tax=Streptomyces sp. NPDC006739 TaxID=3364763 RepID=UPI0036CF0693